MKLGELRRNVAAILATSKFIGDAQQASRMLICDLLDITQTQLLTRSDDLIDGASLIIEKAQRVANGEPLQYVCGKAYFCGHEFIAAPGALIPRPETAELVNLIINEKNTGSIIDIGTGTGCIAISLKLALPDAKVTAVDISADALAIAQKNAEKLDANVTLTQCDILQTNVNLGTFDIVVSNPPYIMQSEKSSMEENVLSYEPHLALFVPDNDPLLFYRTIARHCRKEMLAKGGKLFFEINEKMGYQMKEMLAAEGFVDIQIVNDFYGKERFSIATMPA
ncbi:MAG: peptide chain release factor N(5)-glutamine methyltransferase [Bacteroidales bacterium]|nr:peptide chain release factor N(5)-glutamine methyltransferase [Bacteroidales bacterium]